MMVFKLIQSALRKWCQFDGAVLLKEVANKEDFLDRMKKAAQGSSTTFGNISLDLPKVIKNTGVPGSSFYFG